MTAFLPPNLLALFAAREPLPYLPPAEKLSHEKKRLPYFGLAEYLSEFKEEVKDEKPVIKTETREEKKERRRRERLERAAYKLEQDLALWDPQSVKGTSDPYKTLFVARLSYDTSESKVKREFEEYGSVRKVFLIKDSQTGKSRGYAFVEYEHERDMHSAYKHADGRKIDGRRVVVDYERGRTVKGWRPRRLGGGLGGEKRRAKSPDDIDSANPPNRDRQRSRERESDRRDRGNDRRDRDRDRRRSRSRSRSRDRKRDRSRDRKKDKKRDRSRSRDRKDKDRKYNDERRRKSPDSEAEPGEYKPQSRKPASFDSDGEIGSNGKDRHFDGSSQGF